jgi:hypothetical protein
MSGSSAASATSTRPPRSIRSPAPGLQPRDNPEISRHSPPAALPGKGRRGCGCHRDGRGGGRRGSTPSSLRRVCACARAAVSSSFQLLSSRAAW